jgi:hypothetical protein
MLLCKIYPAQKKTKSQYPPSHTHNNTSPTEPYIHTHFDNQEPTLDQTFLVHQSYRQHLQKRKALFAAHTGNNKDHLTTWTTPKHQPKPARNIFFFKSQTYPSNNTTHASTKQKHETKKQQMD